jgi:hypothetical protein
MSGPRTSVIFQRYPEFPRTGNKQPRHSP